MTKFISFKIATYFALPAALLILAGSLVVAQKTAKSTPDANTGTLEKMVVSTGTVAMQVDWARLNGTAAKTETLQFRSGPSSFMTALVFNGEFRTVESGAISLVPMDSESVPEPLHASLRTLAVEKMPSENAFEFAVRDSATGFVFFNIDRNSYSYEASTRVLNVNDGRLLISSELAKRLGRPADAGVAIGTISLATTMYPIEVATVVNGEIRSDVLPAVTNPVPPDPAAFNAGPDVVVGDLPEMAQYGTAGTRVGLGIATTSCNYGNVDLDWFALPNVDHPVIPQNLYRMSASTDRFEQVGQSWLKHAFTALTQNICALGCNGVGGSHLGTGCSDPYNSSLNSGQSGLGSRAWVNPFTGAYPSTARDHTGHSHDGLSHRVLVEMSDLSTASNPGASYFAEAQYVTPHEYAWCQTHAGQCNMYNNVSYRRFNVSGTTSFSFAANGATVRATPAIMAWTGATVNPVEPVPGIDGRAFVAYKVTGPVNGVYHYEYAVNNQNLDRSIQSFSVPLTCGANVSNVGFHAPLNEAGSAQDGTAGSAGISNAAWTTAQTTFDLTWNTQTFAQNPNANAIRWGTLFNFRFDSDRPPTTADATIGFFKTGSPMTVAIQVPSAACTPLQIATVVSRKTQGSTAYDIDMPLGAAQSGVECRTGGANGDHTLVVSFSNNINSGIASITAPLGGSVSGSPVISANTMTVNLTGVADLQQTAVSLTGVTDGFGQMMPDTAVNVGFLYGDTTGDRQVNISDALQTRGRSGQPIDGTNFRSDVNADGNLNSGDVVVVRGRSGNALPPQ